MHSLSPTTIIIIIMISILFTDREINCYNFKSCSKLARRRGKREYNKMINERLSAVSE
jgi:hypothetical protein